MHGAKAAKAPSSLFWLLLELADWHLTIRVPARVADWTESWESRSGEGDDWNAAVSIVATLNTSDAQSNSLRHPRCTTLSHPG